MFLPSFFVAITFFIENVIIQNIRVFPYVILLMLIPLIIRLLLYFLKLTAENLLKESSNFFTVEKIDEETIKYSWNPALNVPSEFLTKERLAHYAEAYDKYLNMLEMFTIWSQVFSKHKARQYFLTITLILWLMSFTYMLFKIL